MAREVIKLSELYDRYLFLDPAGGKKETIRRVRARSALVVCGVDRLSRVFILHTWAKRAGTNEIVENFVSAVEKWRPKVAGVEEVGQQPLLYDPIITEAVQRSVEVPLAGQRPSTRVDKDFRIRSILQPVVGQGRLFLAEDQHELRAELESFPMSSQKDLVDALAGCVYLIPPPRENVADNTEAEELARYLREQGTPASEIEQRVKEVAGQPEGLPSDSFWSKLFRNKRLYTTS